MNKTIHIIVKNYHSKFGELLVGSIDNHICLCDWKYRKMRDEVDERIKKYHAAEYQDGNSDIINRCIDQLEEYFSGTRENFDLPLSLAGSDFQQSVWNELLEIPYGKTMSYLQLSKKLGNKLAIRAVASANGANAISIIVPCHRVIGSKGELTGYAGGIQVKKALLKLEARGKNEQLELF